MKVKRFLQDDDDLKFSPGKCLMTRNCRRPECNDGCAIFYKVQYVYNQNNVPKKYADWVLQDVDRVEPETKEKCLEHIKNLILDDEYNKGLYLYGAVQQGKTTLATTLLNEFFRRTVKQYAIFDFLDNEYTPILFVSFPRYADLKRDRFKESSLLATIEKHIFKSDLIVLDDITAGNFTTMIGELAFNVIDDIINSGRSFIITDNCEPDKLCNVVGDRISARILNNSIHIKV